MINEGNTHHVHPRSPRIMNRVTLTKNIESMMSINMDHTKENKPLKDFTIQEKIEHVLGLALAQVYGLKKGLKEFGQKGKKCNTI